MLDFPEFCNLAFLLNKLVNLKNVSFFNLVDAPTACNTRLCSLHRGRRLKLSF